MKTIYWAALLTDKSKEKLLNRIQPVHSEVYAEHSTLLYKPSNSDNAKFENMLGKIIVFDVIGYVLDDKGQAAIVSGIERADNKTPHITISCIDGVKPFYSNSLIQNAQKQNIDIFSLDAIISKYTTSGWIK